MKTEELIHVLKSIIEKNEFSDKEKKVMSEVINRLTLYPKPCMRLSELKQQGLSEVELLSAYTDNNQTFAKKVDPTKKNSPIMFETGGLEDYRLKQMATEKRARRCMGVM